MFTSFTPNLSAGLDDFDMSKVPDLDLELGSDLRDISLGDEKDTVSRSSLVRLAWIFSLQFSAS